MTAGKEIKSKMMARYGFAAVEATSLIGAHTIGLTRQTFTVLLAGPWVEIGKDGATPKGPIFDNSYFDFLANKLSATSISEFARNRFPFNIVSPDWFRDIWTDLNHLDTEIVLAFPSQDTDVHPSFHGFTERFAADNNFFLSTFFKSFDQMSRLGVTAQLSLLTLCPGRCVEQQLTESATSYLLDNRFTATRRAVSNLQAIKRKRISQIRSLTLPVVFI